ncbi:MAG: trans-sulfuration enzyme family protein [Candidatus Nanopelagicales bacterium]|jgi:cystathionine gamma-synthase
MEKSNSIRWKLATRLVQAGRSHQPGAPLNPAITLSTGFAAGGDYGYARNNHPTWVATESAIGELENADALLFSSGMAAFNAVIELIPVGGLVVAGDVGYSGIDKRLKDLAATNRIKLMLVPTGDQAAMINSAKSADLVWLDTPTNPTMRVWDIRSISAAAKGLTAVDNTLAGSLHQSPLDLGADISMHSATKQLGGHSDLLAGVLLTRNGDLAEKLTNTRTLTGAVIGAFDAYLLLRGLRTLQLRQERAAANALEIATRLASHPKVATVWHLGLPTHPDHELATAQMCGFGSVFSIVITGGVDAAEKVASSVQLWSHSTSLGGVESQLERRRRWANEPTGVPENLIRLSVGIEDVEDLWADLEQALNQI